MTTCGKCGHDIVLGSCCYTEAVRQKETEQGEDTKEVKTLQVKIAGFGTYPDTITIEPSFEGNTLRFIIEGPKGGWLYGISVTPDEARALGSALLTMAAEVASPE